MLVSTKVSVVVAVSPEITYDFLTKPHTLPPLFRGYGPIPSIESEELEDGSDKLQVGTLRKVRMGDKSTLQEEVLVLNRPTQYVYDIVAGIAPPLSLLVTKGHSVWDFVRVNNGTRIIWTYQLTLTSFLAYPLAALIVKVFMKRALQQCLEAVKAKLAIPV